MATWDGSFEGGCYEDDNCYQYSDPQNVVSNHHPWNYYNTSSNYADNNTVNQPKNFNSSADVFQNYRDHSVNSNTTNLSSNSNYYIEENRPQSNFSTYNCQTDSINDSKPRNIDSHVVSHSNLHPDANEFVPSNIKPVDPSKIFFSDNRSKYSNKKHENRKNNGSYRQQNGEHSRNSYKNYDKNRKDQSSNSKIFTNESYSNPTVYGSQDYLNSRENNEEELINNTSSKDYSKGYKGRKPRNDGKFQNDRFPNSRHYNNSNVPSSSYQNNSSRWRNIPSNHSDSGDREKQSRVRSTIKEQVSRDPRDEKYRGHSSTTYNNYGNHLENDRMPKKDKRQIKNKDTYPEEVCDEKFRNRRDFYEEKTSKGRRTHQTSYRGNYERDSKLDKPEKEKEVQEKLKENSVNHEEKIGNWRQKFNINRIKKSHKSDLDDASSQKERLTEQLNRGHLECLVCCDYIRQNDSIWSCNNCYHVLHLKCIRKWAESSQSESGWRCPACQNANLAIPEEYFCFCGKTRDPEWNRRDVAHSCGEVCGRMRAKNNCVHKCTLLCHPGSCPLCIAMVARFCGCGRTSQNFKCSTDTQLSCDAVCDKLLNCEAHKCERKCHHDSCGPCTKTIHQECFCGKHNRDVTCLPDIPSIYTCEEVCDKLLECENHHCKEKCHPGPCGTCSLKPEIITHCPCGQTPLTIKRESCLDPIPTCNKICSKQLKCGQPSTPHNCKASCHTDDCPQCDLTTWVKCRCGNMDREIPCSDLTTKADDARCAKKCTKKRSCGKHKCNQLCCIDIEHICPLPCSKTLSCGRHKCELTCHKGRCQPCYRSSFEELYCECGAAVIYPPVACGTRRPTCNQPCSRQHPCGHEVLHNCHSEASCPPCTVLTQKWCYGKHELRKAVPCYYNEISCGMPCGKPISCGKHKCITLCHSGLCEKPGQVCTQPCTTPRELCGHICAAPCHEAKCPDIPCKEMVKVTCTCGHRSMTRACAENSREYQRIASGILASKMADMQLGHSVDLEEVFGQSARKQNQLKTLECNDECKTIERNRKLALGLQIANPDLSSKLLPRYSDYMKQWAKKDSSFCQMIHDKLTELVQLAKTSKQKSRSYSFDSMNREKRHFVHEACEHFGCESQAYDQEPKRNVVATAVKDKCWLPSYSLLEMVQRENGQRKVPRPMLNSTKTNTLISRTSEVLPSTAKKTQMLQPSTSTSKSPEQEIDYFDYPNSKWSYM